ncbi:hypothetical protein T265_01052 [Opisthorchis viverrini]|uniref:Uncharacterized protein n=1 Tax=Opisthorchis viverrini TaxID=6198 RepID=A0A075AAW8_OPIVI|nr:hypothetical protein T265_01052 [Opisthorchis viverrini]KER32960.1 hypothetical protein T265_01052 [Opisthorchis viverrini]
MYNTLQSELAQLSRSVKSFATSGASIWIHMLVNHIFTKETDRDGNQALVRSVIALSLPARLCVPVGWGGVIGYLAVHRIQDKIIITLGTQRHSNKQHLACEILFRPIEQPLPSHLSPPMRSYLPTFPNHRWTKLWQLQPLYDKYAVLTTDNDDGDDDTLWVFGDIGDADAK